MSWLMDGLRWPQSSVELLGIGPWSGMMFRGSLKNVMCNKAKVSNFKSYRRVQHKPLQSELRFLTELDHQLE